MAKDKLKLEDLKVQSFVTTLEDEQMEDVKGGFIVKGRRYTFRSRWTSVDTRAENTGDAEMGVLDSSIMKPGRR